MRKLIAVINVIAWSGFWAFGYIALTATELSQRQILTACVLAGLGFLSGVVAYLKLSQGHKINNSALGHTHAQQQG
ncbi:hypothetical protein SAMN06265173_10117 [Thalassovita litoralis]|jgi:hypothetical protein|uniref:Uncharacterized protein n=1 Tax=Thalassovita litoralis TaxID=1010611 RepID=A0A521AAU9_9RHOB|nr:hypothetical protein [Thalassovita litoralis]SMO31932.1 hypothetical protein SAMN06265173_10117 [Thalassovita litoralis]